MPFENLLFEVDGPVATLTLNRPTVLNALNRAVIEELIQLFEQLEKNHEIRVVILTGAGDKAFVAGADIAEMKDLTPEQAANFSARGHDLGDLMASVPQVVIAAVNGFALGGGAELALACDFIYASERAKFGQPEVSLGVVPGFGGTQRLARRVGPAQALELCATGDLIDAAEALRIGLVNRVVPGADLLATAQATALRIASRGAVAVSLVKQAVHASQELPLAEGNRFEVRSFGTCFETKDQKEGMAAFLAKRPPQFTGQ